MYIKIKNLKRFLLVIACLFFAGVNYFTFVKADTNKSACDKLIDADCDGLTNDEENVYKTNQNNEDTDNDGYSDGVEVKSGYNPTIPAPGDRVKSVQEENSIDVSNNVSMTDEFTQNLKSFVESKNGQSVTNQELNTYINESIDERLSSEAVSEDSLPEADISGISVIDQSYPGLSSENKKEKILADSTEYFSQLLYIIISNYPTTITDYKDVQAFNKVFLAKYAALSGNNPDYEYFSDLGKRLELVLEQTNKMRVPESILPLHLKMTRISLGFLELRDIPITGMDPVAKLTMISKVTSLSKLTTKFLEEDLVEYFKQF